MYLSIICVESSKFLKIFLSVISMLDVHTFSEIYKIANTLPHERRSKTGFIYLIVTVINVETLIQHH